MNSQFRMLHLYLGTFVPIQRAWAELNLTTRLNWTLDWTGLDKTTAVLD